MALQPALVYSDLPGPLPATYTLAPSFDIQLTSVSATFNGASASGTFYPCLAVYSQDNILIGRFFPAQALSAGDSAEVTFAPFLGRGATGGSGSYDFIDEKIAVADFDPLVFTGIPQTYRHLAIELLGSQTGLVGNEINLQVWWNGPPYVGGAYGYSNWWTWYTSHDGSGFDTNATVADIDYVLPDGDVVPAGQMGSVRLFFPYYALADVQKNLLWYSGGQDTLAGEENILATFGAATKDIAKSNGNPIADISLAPRGGASRGWKAGSRASLYGIA